MRRLAALAVAVVLASLAARGWDRFSGNASVRFYGAVVDEKGAGVPGVRVTAELTSNRWLGLPMAPRLRRDRLSAVTDEHGRFSFRAWSGRFLSLRSFEKPGWASPLAASRKPQYSFEYPLLGYEYPPGARKKPDNPADPILYTMRRIDGPPDAAEAWPAP